jgi:hypothetical protein
VFQADPIPVKLGILIGEWLYNLRATLDYVIWATAAYVTAREHVLQYPIYDSEQAWKQNLYRLEGLEEHHRTMLLTMQPINSHTDTNFLGWINRLARDDRHRRPHAMTSYIAEINPVAGVPEDATVKLQLGDRLIDNGTADVVRLTVDPWQPDMEVRMNPRLGIDPEVLNWSQSPFWRRWRFTDRLTYLEIFVAAEVATYEYDCTGESRKSQLLTDSYKAECDARPKRQHPSPARRPTTAWSHPQQAAPVSKETLEGIGYPNGPAVPIVSE